MKPTTVTITKGKHASQPYTVLIQPPKGEAYKLRQRYARVYTAKRGALRYLDAVTHNGGIPVGNGTSQSAMYRARQQACPSSSSLSSHITGASVVVSPVERGRGVAASAAPFPFRPFILDKVRCLKWAMHKLPLGRALAVPYSRATNEPPL